MQDTGSSCNDDDEGGNSTPNLLLRQEQQNLPSSNDAVNFDRINDVVGISSDRTMANNYDTYITVIKNNRFTSILLPLCLVLAGALLVVVLQKHDSSSCGGSQVGIGTQSASQKNTYSRVIQSSDAVGDSLGSTSVENSLPSTSGNSTIVDNDISSTSYHDSSSPDQTVSHESKLKEIGYTMSQMPDTSDVKFSTTSTITSTVDTQVTSTPVNTVASSTMPDTSDVKFSTTSTITSTVDTQITRTPVNTVASSTVSATTDSSTKHPPDIYELFKEDIDHLHNMFSCKPRLVKLSIYEAINEPKNAILDENLFPDALAVMRCDHHNSFCCDTYGKETSNKSCTSTKNETKTHRAWYHKENNKLVYEIITIREDLECKCI